MTAQAEATGTVRSGDVEVVWVYGYGFPAWRGGPLRWADSIGLTSIVADLLAFERVHGAASREGGESVLGTPAPFRIQERVCVCVCYLAR